MISLMLLEKSLRTMIIYKTFKSKFNIVIFLLTINQINAGSPETSFLIGSKAPPVSLEKLNGDGFFHLEDTLQLKPVLLLFFSSKNYQSLKMISTIHQIKEGIRDSDIDFYLVNIFEETLREPGKFPEWTAERRRQFQTLTHPEHLGRPFRVLQQKRG